MRVLISLKYNRLKLFSITKKKLIWQNNVLLQQDVHVHCMLILSVGSGQHSVP